MRCIGQHFLQRFEPLDDEIEHQVRRSGDIASRVRKARDNAQIDCFADVRHHNRDRLGSLFRGKGRRRPQRHDDPNLQANELIRQSPKSLRSAIGEAIFNDDVPALDITELA